MSKDDIDSQTGAGDVENPFAAKIYEIPETLSKALLYSITSKAQVTQEIISLDALPFEQTVGIYSRVLAENTNVDGMSRATSQMIDQLNDRLSSMRDTDLTLQITPEQTQQVQGFFDQLRAKLTDLRSNDPEFHEESWRSNLHSLVNRNKELGIIATPIFGDLVSGVKKADQVGNSLFILDALPLEQAVGIFSRVLTENTNMDGMSWEADLMIGMLNERLLTTRARRETLKLTDEEIQSIQGFFDQLRGNLPNLRQGFYKFREDSWRSRLHNLVNQNPEISEQAKVLLEKVGKEAKESLIDHVVSYLPNTSIKQVQEVMDQGVERVVAVTSSINRYIYLDKVLQSLPQDIRQDLVLQLSDSLENDELADIRLSILNDIVSSNESAFLHTNEILDRLGVQLDKLPDIMSDPTITNLLLIMADDPDKYKFQIGVLLSQIPVSNLPEALTEKLKPTLANLEFKINVGHETWWLCGASEQRLLRSIKNGAVILVNDFLLVKFEGKFSALCIKTTSVQNKQTFVEGNWYSQTARDLKANIRLGFDNGASRLTIPSGDWAMMRPLATDQSTGFTASEILEQSQKYAATMPDSFPTTIGEESRSNYRTRKEEDD